jgi:hypothetical protein
MGLSLASESIYSVRRHFVGRILHHSWGSARATLAAAVIVAAVFLPSQLAEAGEGQAQGQEGQNAAQGRLEGSEGILRVRRGTCSQEYIDSECAWICQFGSEEQCQTCHESIECPIRRVAVRRPPIDRNLRSYRLPVSVGVTQLAYDLNWEHWNSPVPHPYARWTTEELLDDIASHGFNAVKIWFKGDPLDGMGEWCWSPPAWDEEERGGPFSCAFGDYGLEDMAAVWSHPAIEVYTMRFISEAWSIREHNARGPNDRPQNSGITFANEPSYHLARALLEKIGHLPKVIVFADWETDWHARGQNSRGYDDEGNMLFPWDDAGDWWSDECWDSYSYQECGEMLVAERWSYVLRSIQRRQAGIEAARAEFPRSLLRVLHALIVNRYPGNIKETDLGYHLVEHIDELEYRPDLIALSFWDRETSIRDALRWIHEQTGYPYERITVDEFGEWRDKDQFERIWNEGRQARCLGVRNLNVWMWKQTWCGTKPPNYENRQHGLFEQTNCPKPSEDPQQPVQFGTARPGLQAALDVLSFEPNEIECEAARVNG